MRWGCQSGDSGQGARYVFSRREERGERRGKERNCWCRANER